MKNKYLIIIGLVFFLAVAVQATETTFEFSHKLHIEEAETACLDCHEGVTSSVTSTDQLLPTMEVCEGCHDAGDVDDMSGLEKTESVLDFPHTLHVSDDNCLTCHNGMAGKESVTET